MNIFEFLDTPYKNISTERSLMHYASQYYDPEKAHEYYMEHRKLKGRENTSVPDTGTGGGSSGKDSGGGAASSQATSSVSNKSSFEEEYERYMFQQNKRIARLQSRLSGLSKEARMLLKDEITAEIDAIREENMNKKYELKAKYGKGSGSGSSGKSALAEKSAAAFKAKWG